MDYRPFTFSRCGAGGGVLELLCAGEACSFQVDIMAHPPTPLTLASSLRVDPVGGYFIAAQKRGLRAHAHGKKCRKRLMSVRNAYPYMYV